MLCIHVNNNDDYDDDNNGNINNNYNKRQRRGLLCPLRGCDRAPKERNRCHYDFKDIRAQEGIILLSSIREISR